VPIFAPQRRRVDDAPDDVAERLRHALCRLGGRLDEEAPVARRKARALSVDTTRECS
jgi:hypothetical protein